MVQQPAALLAASGLFLTSLVAAGVSVSQSGGRSVEHMVTVPGVPQTGGVLGASAPRGNSPFAVYSPPPSPATAPDAGTASPAAPAPAPAPPKKKPHG